MFKILFVAFLLLGENICFSAEPNLKETLEWLKLKIPCYTKENRGDDFEYLLEDYPDNAESKHVSFWQLSYTTDNLCDITLTLTDMRKYEFSLSNVTRIYPKERHDYIKLVIETVKDKIVFEQINNNDNCPELLPEKDLKNIVSIDFPIFAKDAALNVAKAFKYAVMQCKDCEKN
jgi:hypothetical protein